MKASIMQPSFAPWLGYFALIAASEKFVLLDDAQVSLQSWNDRNRVFLQGSTVGWINAPLRKKGNFGKNFKEMPLDPHNRGWRKLGKTLAQQYGKAPFFKEVQPTIETWLSGGYVDLAALNSALIMELCRGMGLNPEWIFSSSLNCQGKRSAKVLDILDKIKADTYFSARGSFDYMSREKVFPLSKVEVLFQDFRHPVYPQCHSSEFVSHLSILDALYYLGFHATGEMIRNAAQDWQTWEEMENLTERQGSAAGAGG